MDIKKTLFKKVNVNGMAKKILIWLTIFSIGFGIFNRIVLAYNGISVNKEEIKLTNQKVEHLDDCREESEKEMIGMQKDVESIKGTVEETDNKVDMLIEKLIR